VTGVPSLILPAGDGWQATVSWPRHAITQSKCTNKALDWAGVDIMEFPKLEGWLYRMLERPGVEKGRHIPKKHTALDQAKKSAEELDREAKSTSGWVQNGMKGDAKK